MHTVRGRVVLMSQKIGPSLVRESIPAEGAVMLVSTNQSCQLICPV